MRPRRQYLEVVFKDMKFLIGVCAWVGKYFEVVVRVIRKSGSNRREISYGLYIKEIGF